MSESDQLKRAMEAPIVRKGPTPDTAENYESMCPASDGLVDDTRAAAGNVIDMSEERKKRTGHEQPEANDEEKREAEAG